MNGNNILSEEEEHIEVVNYLQFVSINYRVSWLKFVAHSSVSGDCSYFHHGIEKTSKDDSQIRGLKCSFN